MSELWTPAKRAICALTLGQPDEIPTFELEYQLAPQMFGYEILGIPQENFKNMTNAELERAMYDLADRTARVFGSVV